MDMQTNILLILVTPLAGAVLILLAGRFPNLRESVSLVTAVILFALVLHLLPHGEVVQKEKLNLFTLIPGINGPGIDFSFRLEPLGMIFLLIASGLWIINTIYSIGYMRENKEKNQTRFYFFFAVSITATMGLALSSNLFTLFVFYEALTLATYPLVTHKGTDEAMKSGRIYLGILLATSIGLLFTAIAITWFVSHSTEFTVHGILSGEQEPWLLSLLLLLYLFGVSKTAIMPLHKWLPSAMVAPTPVSALLHAVAVVKAGVFTMSKILLYIFGIKTLKTIDATTWMMYLAGLTIITASIFALRQDNLKLRLAYSTVSQLSYVLLAALLLSPIVAALHIAVHAFGKITLFFTAGSIYTVTHKTHISELQGIGYKMPLTMIAFCAGALSMVGLPLTAGFISKWHLFSHIMHTQNWFVIFIMIASTTLSAAYYFPVAYTAFQRNEQDSSAAKGVREAPKAIVFTFVVTAIITVGFFFYPDPILDLAKALARSTGV
jgi:multicomponent Na+:H+ antiporter subunit D